METQETYFRTLPSRIRYYLLEWKDDNLDSYLKTYGELKLKDMTQDQIHELFSMVTTNDSAWLAKLK
jgi:hypothetical protein